PAPKAAASPDTDDDLNAYRQRVVAAGFTPRSLIIDESDHILNASPDLQDYFGFTSGDHRTDVVQMAHPDLRHGLSLAIQDARRGRCRIQRDNLTIRDATTVRGVMVTVEPLPALGDSAEPYLVVLQELGLPKPRIEQATAESRTNQSESQALVSTLESELETTRREFGRSLEAARMDAVNVDLKNSKVQRQGALSRYLGIPSRGTLEAYFGRVHPDDLEGLKSAMNSPSVQEPIYSAVYRFRRGNRGWVWLEDEAEVTFDEQGQPIRLTGVCRDVSVQREAQLAQLSRERQIRTIIDAIPALVAYLDSDLRYQFANREYRAQFDPDAGDIVGQSASEVLTPEAFALAEPKLAAALEGKSQCYELELPDPVSGAPSFKEVNYLPDFNAKGDIAGCFVMATDVTERRLAAQIVESRERELSSLISSTAEGIYGIDLEGVCTFANEACIRLLGFEDVSQLVGRQMHELIHHHLNDGRRYDNEDCAIYRALRKGREVHVDDEVFWRADGSQLEVEYWSYPQVVDGQVVGCVVTFLDSTERRSWERELEEREGHLRRVIDNMLGLVGVLTPDGTLVEVNEAALRIGALAREDVIGRPFWDCYWWNYDDVSVARLRGWVERALNGELIREDVPVRIVDGELMEIDFQLVPVHDADGKVEYLVPSGLDISDRKRTEELAAARERQLNLALEAGKMGAFEWDLMHGRVAWSDHLYRIMAQPVEEFDGRLATVQALIAPEDQDRIAKRLANQWQSDSLDHDAEYRVVGPNDDQMIWLHERGSIQRDRSGRAVAVLGIVSDITERKRRELGLAFLADLQVDMVGATSIDELLRATGSRLATHMSLSRCAIFEFDDASPLPQLIHEHRSDRRVSRIGSGPLETLHSRSEWKLLAEGGVLVVSETRSGSRSSTNRKRLEALRIGSFVHVVHSYRQHAGLSLLATKERGHTWLPDEITFLGQLVDQLQPRLERARAIATLHQSERRLRISEELLKVGTEVANLAILKIDYHRDQCELSAEAAELYGLGVSEMVVSRERSRETCHADDRAGLDAAFEGCLDPEGDGNCTHEHRVHWPNGEVRWIRVQKRVYFDRTQRPPKPTHAILAAQDITTRKHWEIELADREAHLRRVINNQLGLVGVIGTDGRLMEIDDDSLSIAGIQREDVIGKHFAECRWWTYDDDVATTMKRSMERAFAGELVRYDVPLYAQGNQTLMIDFMLAPVWDEDDRIEYLIYSGVDISERKRAERRLEESEQRLALALEAAGMGTFVWEAETGEAVCDPQHFTLSGLDRGATKLIERLRDEMNTAADRLDFERAAELRDQIKLLSNRE
ncbi:MAG: PAS domain S-box protein, partial [Planctomycetes bacterium]|nr:PAS domain S-box protein [Planctomycetota bacterium]